MSFKKFLQNSGFAALAATLVFTALPASAQDRPRNREARAAAERLDAGPTNRNNNASQRRAQGQQRADRANRASEPRTQRVERRTEQRDAQVDRRTDRRVQRVEQRSHQRVEQAQRRGNVERARQIDRRGDQRASRTDWRGDQRATRVEQRGNNRANRVERRADRRDNDRWQNDNRRWNNNDSWRGNDRRDNRRWDRRWRDNNRYDWQGYRNSNRVVFRLGSYYSPYRNYSYRRVGIGGVLNSLFFGSSYWISDPWQYRLPEVYGSYRWVRYYDDVLLVDTYSGEVVDVIYDFFW